VTQAGEFQRIACQFRKVDLLPIPPPAGVPRLSGFQHLLDRPEKAIRVFKHDAIKVPPVRLVKRTTLKRLEIQAYGSDGRFQFVVTALRKLSWRSFRRISRTMKIVLTTRPAMITPKKIIPKTSGTTCRQWNTIHVMFRKTASATRQAPSVMKNAMAFVRL